MEQDKESGLCAVSWGLEGGFCMSMIEMYCV